MILSRNAVCTLRGARSLSTRASAILSALDIPTGATELPGVYDGQWSGSGDVLESVCPTTGEVLARVRSATPHELHEALRKRDVLGALVSLEMGKIKTEGIGEVQEFVDICDYAVGLSRMMNGRVVASERPGHTILELPNPIGVVGVLTAFNFPVAVYGWNFSLSVAAGNANVWKPSPSTSLCSIAVTKIIAGVLEKNGLPGAVSTLITGGKDVGEAIVESQDIPLVSFTGSEAVGRVVGKAVQSRFGKSILELGGNNASIIMPDADLALAVTAVFFGAVGTAGQRCTSTRRLYLHRAIAPKFLDALQKLYATVCVGDPLVEGTLLGPLHTRAAVGIYSDAVQRLRQSGADILTGGKKYDHAALSQGNFVQPTIAVPKTTDPADKIWSTETFAPILNVCLFDELEQAIEWNNAVPQGLSSSLWTRDLRNVGKWIGPEGSDAGIVNVNVGTSGAEIGAAFGGNKQYVRWSACTVNFSDAAPLAQGVNFST
ncbi:NAD-aldehyde dehydrogenase [Suillus ampliporus]|nr:NAD-aldehyde dehydrogenase [Suillus ampliporus]